MHKLLNLIKTYQLPILTGFLVGTSYVPFPPWALLFAYAPLWIFSLKEETTLRKAFLGAWLSQFILTLIGFYWIYVTAKDFGSMPAPIALAAVLAFASLIHIYIPISVALIKLLHQKLRFSRGQALLLLALSHSLLERVWPSIFDWNLGYTLLWQRWPAFQWADTVGFLGLSTIILLLNSLFALSFWQKPKTFQQARPALMALLIFLILNLSGHLKERGLPTPDQKINFLAIQANIGNSDRMYAEKGAQNYQEAILDQFIEQTKSALAQFPETEMLVWPESAVPDYLDQNLLHRKNAKKLADELSSHKIPIITGAFSKDLRVADADLSVFNGLFLMHKDSSSGQLMSEVYRKTHLLAFGEYLPFSESFPILLKWLPFVSNFGRGHGPQVLTLTRSLAQPLLFGGQICYEGLYPQFSVELAKKGAQILVNVTNDSWFGKHSEPEQHMIMTLARAIEVRRPLIRSTNTGITTAILANGHQLQRSPIHEVWSGPFSIAYQSNPKETFYMKLVPYDLYFLFFLFVLILLFGGPRVRTQKP